MIHFVALHLRNVLFFKKASFKLDGQPLAFIYGRNWNASGGTNAAGKSLLFSQIPELIYGEPLVGVKRDRLRDGSVALDLKKGGVPYRIVRTLKKGKETLRVLRKGKDLAFRELAEARKFIEDKLIGCSREEFETRVYLDVQAPHPLIRGDTAARKRFFTEFFNLNSHEGMLAVLRTEMRIAADAAARAEVLRSNLVEAREQLASYQKTTSTDLRVLEKRVASLSETIEEARKVATLMERCAELPEDVVALAKRLVKPFEPNSLKKAQASLEEKLERHEEHVEAFQEQQEAATRLKVLKEQLSSLKLEQGSDEDRVKISKLPALERRIAEIAKEQSTVQAKLFKIEEEIEQHETTPDTCSKCGQAWPHKVPKEHKKALLKEAEVHSKRSTELEEQLEELQQKRARVLDLKQTLSNAKLRLQRTEEELEKQRKATSSTVEAPDSERAKRLRTQLRALANHQNALVGYMRVEKLSEESKRGAAELDNLVAKHLRLIEQLASAKHQAEERSRIKERLKGIKSAIQEAEERTAEVENLKVLAQAYSKKGLPNLMIKTICTRLEEVVNKYASFLFSEDYSFSFQLDTQFVISVTRQYQGTAITSDVRKLSGAESRLFNILLLLGLITFVPEKRRTNILILDEPDASMGDENIELLMRFLGVLNRIIPNIIVITPKTYEVPEKARIFTVVKKGTESRLVHGTT